MRHVFKGDFDGSRLTILNDDLALVRALAVRGALQAFPADQDRLGATRAGSFGILGYTGGQGASIIPAAMSRSTASPARGRR